MPAINPQNHQLNYAKAEIGSYALDLSRLSRLGIPLPATYCLPVSTLKLIANHNHLEDKFEQLLKTASNYSSDQLEERVQQVQAWIIDLAIPHTVRNKLFEIYQNNFQGDFVRLTASPVDNLPIDYKREDNIQGESNLIESILTLWAHNIDPADIKKRQLYPVAIVIQAQFQPTAAGLAYSLDLNTHDKSKIAIQAVWGVFESHSSFDACDYILIDRRDWLILSNDVVHKRFALHRTPDKLKTNKVHSLQQSQPALDTETALKLAKLVSLIKLQFTHQVIVHWELVGKKLLITKIKPYLPTPLHPINETKYATIALGQTVNPGYIQGIAEVITNQKQLAKFKPGNIAVIKFLNPEFQSLIYKCGALIIEERVTNNWLLSQLRRFQVPCLINTSRATHSIRDQQPVVVDASAGRVYVAKNQALTYKHSQSLDLLLAINDASELDQLSAQLAGGVGIIRSEHFLIKKGVHPERLIKTKAQDFLDQCAHQLTTLYHQYYSLAKHSPVLVYRSCNLHTNQLAQLAGGEIYEQPESNPFLGLRGAMRILCKPKLFELELSILAKANSQIDQPINLMLPFVRSNLELSQLNRVIESHFASAVYRPPLWLQLNTPENLLNLESYLQQPLSAICINLNSIHALMRGVDPTFEDLYNQYPMEEVQLKPHLQKAVELIKQKKPDLRVYFISWEYQQWLIELALNLQVTGMIAQPTLIKEINQFLLNHSK